MPNKEAPSTHIEQKALNEQLLAYAHRAVHQGTSKGLAKLIGQFDSKEFRTLLVYWLEKFTPIRRDLNSRGNLLFCVPSIISEGYDLAGARLNPYYTVEQVFAWPAGVKNDRKPNSKVSTPISTYELERKRLKLALDRFLTERSVESRKHLIELINQQELTGASAARGFILQGGAPGLGRNR